MNIMHTMASETRTTQVPKRRFYSPELKLKVVQTCAHPGASIAAVALQHGINTNIVHRWIREHSQGTLVIQPQAFVPVTLSTEPEPVAPNLWGGGGHARDPNGIAARHILGDGDVAERTGR